MPRARPFGWWRPATQVLLGANPVDAEFSTFTNGTFAPTADGVTTATLTYTARNADEDLLAGETVTFAVSRVLVSAALSTVTATTEIADDGVASATCTIRILDANGDPVSGVPAASCVLAVSGAGNTVTQPASASNANGYVSGSFVSTTAASKTVSFTICGLAITDTATTVVTGTPSDYPNEPDGYTAIYEHDMDALPSGANGITGSYLLTNPSSYMTATTEATAPQSPTTIINLVYPDGFADGSSPGRFSGSSDFTQRSGQYFSYQIRIAEAEYENHSVLTKMMFFGVGTVGGGAYNEVFLALRSPSAGRTHSEFKVELRQQGHVSRNMVQNVDTSALFTCEDWHQVEVLMELNSAVDVADGTARWWIDGTLAGEYTDVVWNTTAASEGFRGLKYDPTYGGNSGETKTGDANWQMDHIYYSGVV